MRDTLFGGLGGAGGLGASARPAHKLFVFVKAHANNAIVQVAGPGGATLPGGTFSGGALKFKGANRAGHEAGYQCAARALRRVEEAVQQVGNEARLSAQSPPPVHVEVRFNGFGKGRDAFMSALTLSEGEAVRPLVVRMVDCTPIKIGGTRAKKERRR
jgi:small subunit ribosomal protein S11